MPLEASDTPIHALVTHDAIPDRQTALDALTTAKAVLASDPTGPHSPETIPCPECRHWWTLVNNTPTQPDDPETTLTRLAATIPAAPHPTPECACCDGCHIELDMAMTTIALATVGLNDIIAFGPWHRSDNLHDPADWETCPNCTTWVTERTNARTTLTNAGLDANRWLGPDDIPAL